MKGTPTSSTLIASVPATSGGMAAITFSGSAWLASQPSGSCNSQATAIKSYPRKQREYSPEELFWPLTGTATPTGRWKYRRAVVSVHRAVVHVALDHSQSRDDAPFLSSFSNLRTQNSPAPQQVIAAVQPLIASSSIREQIVGLTAALRVGSTDALNTFTARISTLQNDPEFSALTSAIGMYPKYKDQTWVAPLQNLVNLQTGAPGVDAAAAGALASIRSKGALPIMAELLDSKDPRTQLAAARYFGVFSLLANSNGNYLIALQWGLFPRRIRGHSRLGQGQISPPRSTPPFGRTGGIRIALLGFPAQ